MHPQVTGQGSGPPLGVDELHDTMRRVQNSGAWCCELNDLLLGQPEDHRDAAFIEIFPALVQLHEDAVVACMVLGQLVDEEDHVILDSLSFHIWNRS